MVNTLESFNKQSHEQNTVYKKCIYQNPVSFIFSCEHASNQTFDTLIKPSEQHFFEEHWGYDIGIAKLTKDLSVYFQVNSVFSNFSRLLIDPNRDLNSVSLIPEEIEGFVLSFNKSTKDLDSELRKQRIKKYYLPYHHAFQKLCVQTKPKFLISMHSFTPNFGGKTRNLEIGVLFNAHDQKAAILADLFKERGLKVGLNVPYSGKEGFIFAAQKYGEEFAIPYFELEFRNDLLADQKSYLKILEHSKKVFSSFSELKI